MSESTLPYLEKIAKAIDKMNSDGSKKQSEALQSISKEIGTYNVTSQTVNMGTSENTKEIADAVKLGLVTEVTEEQGGQQVQVEKGILDVMKEAFVQVFREAMFTVVGEGSAAHEESVFKVMKDEIVEAIGEINTTLDGIKDAEEEIADALTGSGGSGGIVAQINDISQGVQNTNNSIGTWSTGDATVLSRLYNLQSSLGDKGNGNTAIADIRNIYQTIGTPSQGDLSTWIETIKDSVGLKGTGYDIITIARSIANEVGNSGNLGTIGQNVDYIRRMIGTTSDAGTENTVEGRLQYIKVKVANL